MTGTRARRKYTVAQAKNIMRRAVAEIVDPSPASVDAVGGTSRAAARTADESSIVHRAKVRSITLRPTEAIISAISS